MRKICLLLGVLMILTGCVSTVKMYNFQVPEPIKADTLKLENYETRYQGYDLVYLDAQNYIEHTNIPYWTYSNIFYLSYLVLNPQSSTAGSFVLDLDDHEELKNLSLRIIYPSGEIQNFSVKDCKKEGDSEKNTTYKFSYPNLVKGAIIQESYEINLLTYNNNFPPFYDDFSIQYTYPVLSYKYAFVIPKEWEAKIKSKPGAGKIKMIETKSFQKEYVYTDRDIPGYKDEAYSPSLDQNDKTQSIKLSRIKINMQGREIDHSFPVKWEEILTGLSNYTLSSGTIFSPNVKEISLSLTQSCQNEEEKIEKIIHYVQKNIKLSDKSESTYENILEIKKGNPYRICGLTIKMLEYAGIESDFVICMAKTDGSFDRNFVSPSELRHPGVLVYLNDKAYLSIPYSKIADFRKVSSNFSGQSALVVKQKNNTTAARHINNLNLDLPLSNGQLITLPADSEINNQLMENLEINIHNDNTFEMSQSVSVTGEIAANIRIRLFDKDKEEQVKYLKKILKNNNSEVFAEDFIIENLDEITKPLVIKMVLSYDSTLTQNSDKIIYDIKGFTSSLTLMGENATIENRSNPIYIPYNHSILKFLKINYPPSWETNVSNLNVQESNKIGEISNRINVEKGTIQLEQRVFLKKYSGTKYDYPFLHKLTNYDFSKTLSTIIFTKK